MIVVPNSHESALDLAKLLVEKDTSWKFTSSNVDVGKPKPHNFGCLPKVPSTYETGGNLLTTFELCPWIK